MAIWLLTGATGFVGRHVLEVCGTDIDGSACAGEHTVVLLGRRCPDGWPQDRFVAADLTEPHTLPEKIRQIAPDVVIHTAGRTPPALDDELFRTNFWATVHLLTALRSMEKPARVVLSGSAAELGPVDAANLPVDENYTGFPREAYGRSKSLATAAGIAERGLLDVMVARLFNPIGPGTPASQALGRFADRLTDYTIDPLHLSVGDLETRRDFVDVRDVARAMVALAMRGQARQVYNVGTGQSHRVGDGLEHLIQLSGRSVRVSVDPELERRRGPLDSRANIDRIGRDTGWKPEITWEQSLIDMWNEVAARKRRGRGEHGAAA